MGHFAAFQHAASEHDLATCCQLLGITAPALDPTWYPRLQQTWHALPMSSAAKAHLCWHFRRQLGQVPLPHDALLAILTWYKPDFQPWCDQLSLTAKRWLCALLACSQIAQQRLQTHANWSKALLQSPYLKRAKPLVQFQQEVTWLRSSAQSHSHLCNRLRRYRMVEWCRIVGRMAAKLAPQQSIELELSHLAQAIVQAMLHSQWRRCRQQYPKLMVQPVRLLVVAQGKLGSMELNVSSDIDIQCIAGTPDGQPLPDTMAQLLSNLVQSLHRELTQHNQQDLWCYRVDLELRPGGKQGPLITTIAALEQHYSTLGQTWERLAWLRSRRLAGPAWLWQHVQTTLKPFVLSSSQDPKALQAMAQVRQLSQATFAPQTSQLPLVVDLKREPGGIRDIELFTHILQVLHGYRYPQLAKPHPIPIALGQLAHLGIVSLHAATQLRRAYRWLRRCEHWLQAWQDRQTYTLPQFGTPMWYQLSQWMGIKAPLPNQADGLAKTLATIAKRVRYRCTPKAPSPLQQLAPNVQAALSGPAASQQQALCSLGFTQLHSIQQHLAPLLEYPASLLHASNNASAGQWLCHLAQTPQPDMALLGYARLEPQLWRKPALLHALRQSAPLRQNLADILSASPYLSQQLQAYPAAIAYLLPSPPAISPTDLQSATLCQQTWQQWHQRYQGIALQSIEHHDPMLRDWLQLLHDLRHRHTLHIGLLDLTQQLKWSQVSRGLSNLAGAVVQLAMQTAEALTPTIPPGALALLTLGRLGSGAMSYGSDVDLLFVYDEQQDHCPQQLLRRAQHLITLLTRNDGQGPLYAVDTQLRPNGQQGPLCCSLAALEQYHRQHAALWERQALLSANVLTAAPKLRARTEQLLTTLCYQLPIAADGAEQLQQVRQRQQQELGNQQTIHSQLKWGRGGLMELTSLVQWLQLHHGANCPPLRTNSLLQAIVQLQHIPKVTQRERRQLLASYLFLRRLELRLRLLAHPHPSPLPTNPWQQVAAHWHRSISSKQLAQQCQRQQLQVQQLYQRWLG